MTGVQSVERAFSVLRCLAAGPAGVSEIAEMSRLPKSTVSRLLSTLAALGAVEQVDSGGLYRIGPMLVELVARVAPGRGLVQVARPHLFTLVESLGEAAGLSILERGQVFYLDQIDGDHAVQVRDWTGERVPAHVVSSGLVLLAAEPADRLDDLLSKPLEAFTPTSMTDPQLLRRRIAEVAANGWAWVFEEYAPGINSVAAPIRDPSGAVVAAVHAHGPSYRFPGVVTPPEAVRCVVDAAVRISAGLA